MYPRTLQRHYKKQISGFDNWSQKSHCEEYLIYTENIGPYLSLDEVSLSKGEIYTYLTNKNGRGKKGTLVACVKGVKSEALIQAMERIPLHQRKKVKKVTIARITKKRSVLLFKLHPSIEKAYKHTLAFRNIYEQKSKKEAKVKFKEWIEKTKELGLKNFNTALSNIKYLSLVLKK